MTDEKQWQAPLQHWQQDKSTHFDTYEDAAAHRATLTGKRIRIRRRVAGFDVVQYKPVDKKKDDHLEEKE